MTEGIKINRNLSTMNIGSGTHNDRLHSISPQAYNKNGLSNISIIDKRNTIDNAAVK